MVTSGKVRFIEGPNGCINNLNLAGENGIEFSLQNKASVKLPDERLLDKKSCSVH
jgi:hypothetical protein